MLTHFVHRAYHCSKAKILLNTIRLLQSSHVLGFIILNMALAQSCPADLLYVHNIFGYLYICLAITISTVEQLPYKNLQTWSSI